MRKPWTPSEREIVRAAYQQAGGNHHRALAIIGGRLPGRARKGIMRIGNSLRDAEESTQEPRLLPWGQPPGRCPHCGSVVLARQIEQGVYVGTTPDGDYECLICGTVQYVEPRKRR